MDHAQVVSRRGMSSCYLLASWCYIYASELQTTKDRWSLKVHVVLACWVHAHRKQERTLSTYAACACTRDVKVVRQALRPALRQA